MGRPGHVETWDGIAVAVGRSLRTCRNLAGRSRDPLPVHKVGGIVRLNLADLDAWLDRQREATIARPVAAAGSERVEEHW